MSAAARASSSIPASARKVVQDLKEIVNNSDDEIYAMLRECNMDPNETVQRLLSQDTFHEVKRKRDKKKDNSSKDFAEVRSRAPGLSSSIRGGRSRGQNYSPRSNSEYSSSRGQSIGVRDSASHQNGRAAKSSVVPSAPLEVQAKAKNATTNTSNDNSFVPATASSSTIPNGTSLYSKVVQGSSGVWGAGHATLAEIVKSSNALHGHTNISTSVPSKVAAHQPGCLPDDALALSTDHGNDSSINVGTVGSTSGKENGVLIGSLLPDLNGSFREVSEKTAAVYQSSSYTLSDTSSSTINVETVNSDMPSTSAPTTISREIMSELEIGVPAEASSLNKSSELPETQHESSSVIGGQYSGRVSYQSQVTGNEKGSGLDWRPKSPIVASPSYLVFNSGSDPASRSTLVHDNTETLKLPASKLQQLSIHEDQPVIIPDHLQVPEADRSQLNFGSFGEEFNNSNFADEDVDADSKSIASVEDNIPDEEAALTKTNAASSKTSEPVGNNYSNQSKTVDTLVGREDTKMDLVKPEVTKTESALEQNSQHPALPTIPGFSGTGSMPQIASNQFPYDQSESQNQDAPRVQNFMSYSDPATNASFFNPVYRPSADLDARYAQFVSTSATSKYNPGASLISGQGLSASQESGNSVIPSTSHLTQTSQTVGLTQGSLTIPQQHIPIHAYPAQHAGVPLTPFGANVLGIHYVPPTYGYMHSPYQHSYVGSTGYPQATGSNYAPGNSYTPAAGAPYNSATSAAAMKYALPQYKPATTAGNVPHASVATGYGNFSTSPSGFTTINAAVTSATASGYDDVNGLQYKENNVFIPSQQQAEGSGVWIQNMPSRDMTPMQTNSYYNLLCQNQHTSFTHTQPMHGAVPSAAYASLYHQSQSGTAPAVHQLLQQPQTLGTVGGVGSQSGGYPQQRGQLNWPPNY